MDDDPYKVLFYAAIVICGVLLVTSIINGAKDHEHKLRKKEIEYELRLKEKLRKEIERERLPERKPDKEEP